MKLLKWLLQITAWTLALLCTVWAIGALFLDFPFRFGGAAAILFALILFAAVIFARGPRMRLATVFCGFGLVVCWWLTLRPSNDRPWQPDVAQTAWADIDGDLVTVHNVRNCDYRTETDFTTRWETRSVRLSQITGMDLAIAYWGSPWIAHTMVSFRFADSLPLSFSIETRKTIGQSYSALRGLYRQYTLVYIVADERDLIRVRTNFRHDEKVYLYHTTQSPAQARIRFLEYLDTMNALRNQPRWYNAVTSNCTTNIRTQHSVDKRVPWNWRILLNGKGDEMLYERHAIVTAGLPFEELKKRSLINERARSADRDPDFSIRIRDDLPQGN